MMNKNDELHLNIVDPPVETTASEKVPYPLCEFCGRLLWLYDFKTEIDCYGDKIKTAKCSWCDAEHPA